METRIWYEHYDYKVPTSLRIPRIPVHELINLPASAFPDKTAINYYGSKLSFWELRDRTIRMANALQAIGIEKGDRVGIQLPNLPQYPIAYYAILQLGAIVVNFSPLYTCDEMIPLIKKTGLKAIISFDMMLLNIREVLKSIAVPIVIGTSVFDFMEGAETSSSASLGLNTGWYHFSQLIDECSDRRLPKVDISGDDPALIQFTGGTTGEPKGATLTHQNIIAGAFMTSVWGSPSTELVAPEKRNVMLALPLFHVYANIVGMNWAMINCAEMILVPRFEIDPFMDLLVEFDRICFFPAVPTMINAILNHPKAETLNLAKKISLLNSGGGPIPTEVIDRVKETGTSYSEGWGMSETTSIGITNPNLGLKKNGSIGIPMPSVDVKIVELENDGIEVAPGTPGELLIKGPMVMKEYWENPEQTKQNLKDGWLNTGDIVTMDEDGYLFLVDRKKDMIIAGGYNIYPREIDEVLYQHPKVSDAVAVGIADPYRGETVKAFIVPKSGENLTEEEILAFCREKLSAYKIPKIIEFRDDLPKSAVGKILRKILQKEEREKA